MSEGRGLEPDVAWEAQVREAARSLPYPPTPELAPAVLRRLKAPPAHRSFAPSGLPRPAWVAAAIVLLLVGLLAVPQVRAAVIEALRLGNVRILPAEPAPTPAATRSQAAPGLELPNLAAPPDGELSPTPHPAATSIISALDLMGETTLDEAREVAPFEVRLPAYPPDLGPPQHVYRQELGDGVAVVLVWVEPDRPGDVRLALQQLGPGALVDKIAPAVVEETEVDGRPALWATGPYVLRERDGDYDTVRLVTGNTLIWEEAGITYRLESRLPLAEAVKIAESLLSPAH